MEIEEGEEVRVEISEEYADRKESGRVILKEAARELDVVDGIGFEGEG